MGFVWANLLGAWVVGVAYVGKDQFKETKIFNYSWWVDDKKAYGVWF